jgi:putative DNA primase/helicase
MDSDNGPKRRRRIRIKTRLIELRRVQTQMIITRRCWQNVRDDLAKIGVPTSTRNCVVHFMFRFFHEMRQVSDEQFVAICPSHDDQTPSLSFKVDAVGKVQFKCHAGCSYFDVLRASGLELFACSPIVDTYDYFDSDGNFAYQVCRTAHKQFPPRHLDDDGGWQWGRGTSHPLLYRLQEFRRNRDRRPEEPLFICEGEKDVERCVAEGLIATCGTGGAGGPWLASFSEEFRGREVLIPADNDEAGLRHAEKVARSVIEMAACVRIVQLPDLPPHGDVSDFFDQGHSRDELLRFAEQTTPSSRDMPSNGQKRLTVALLAGSERTDLGNARLFAAMHCDSVRFNQSSKKWLVWDGTRWKNDDIGKVHQLAKGIADLRWREAQERSEQVGFGFATYTASTRGIQNMLKLAESEPLICVSIEVFDRNPMLLNCPNGTLELETASLREHSRDDLITKVCNTPYDPHAAAPNWLKAIDSIFESDHELMGFFQRFFGMCLTGDVREQVLVVLYGDGSNGKSLLLNAMLETVGRDFFIKASDELLIASTFDRHPTALADLHGVRLAVVLETDQGRRISEALVKSLTGGDPIRARRMREDFWEFMPTHKFALCTNHLPRVVGSDNAIWRRILVIRFMARFWDPDRTENRHGKLPIHLKADKALAGKLREEREGILAWLVQGCLEWQRHGLRIPQGVALATAEYQRNEDAFGRFLEEECETGPSFKIQAALLYARYRSWCDRNGEFAVVLREFSERLLARGYKRIKSNNTFYQGLRLRQSGLAGASGVKATI